MFVVFGFQCFCGWFSVCLVKLKSVKMRVFPGLGGFGGWFILVYLGFKKFRCFCVFVFV